MRRSPDSCFVNNYFKIGLEAWEANIDIQPVFSYYKAVSYTSSFFFKCESESFQAMKKAAEKSKDLSFGDRMKKLAIAFLSHRKCKCSLQEAVYARIMAEKDLSGCYFLPDKRYRVCKSQIELSELPADSTEVFKRNNLDRYLDRADATFKSGYVL